MKLSNQFYKSIDKIINATNYKDTDELRSIAYFVIAKYLDRASKMDKGYHYLRYVVKRKILEYMDSNLIVQNSSSASYIKKVGMDKPSLYPLSFCDATVENDYYQLTVDEILELLNPMPIRGVQYVKLKSLGYTDAEVARCLNLTRQRVNQIKNAVKERWQKIKKEV